MLRDAGVMLCHLLQAECSRNSTTVRALLRSWRASAPAHAARALGSSSDGLLELAPALRDISRPAAVRAVNAQLLSRDEEQVLTHVVSMGGCALPFAPSINCCAVLVQIIRQLQGYILDIIGRLPAPTRLLYGRL